MSGTDADLGYTVKCINSFYHSPKALKDLPEQKDKTGYQILSDCWQAECI